MLRVVLSVVFAGCTMGQSHFPSTRVYDEYGQSLLSNDHLEHESIDGIEKILSVR